MKWLAVFQKIEICSKIFLKRLKYFVCLEEPFSPFITLKSARPSHLSPDLSLSLDSLGFSASHLSPDISLLSLDYLALLLLSSDVSLSPLSRFFSPPSFLSKYLSSLSR